ncbi:MAG TPA: DUF3568 family protein [Candidatus Acidoferrum sp.]|jgi:hypothetical protein|nr:DUF3568 family protein [Candidatus Acidoferrum sp.]
MKMKIFAALASVGMALGTAGCVNTVSGTYTSGFHNSDKVVSRYQRSVDEVYAAAIAVINNNGVLITEFIPHDTTNTVRSLEAKVDKETIYIRVEAVDPQITQVTIQARTNVAGDVQEAHELDKEILLKLANQNQ